MPDAMAVGQFLIEDIKYDTTSVKQTSGNEPDDAACGQVLGQWIHRNDNDPAH